MGLIERRRDICVQLGGGGDAVMLVHGLLAAEGSVPELCPKVVVRAISVLLIFA
jgi:predicted glycosyltransferase